MEEVGLDDHREGRGAVRGIDRGLALGIEPVGERAQAGRAHLDLGDDRRHPALPLGRERPEEEVLGG